MGFVTSEQALWTVDISLSCMLPPHAQVLPLTMITGPASSTTHHDQLSIRVYLPPTGMERSLLICFAASSTPTRPRGLGPTLMRCKRTARGRASRRSLADHRPRQRRARGRYMAYLKYCCAHTQPTYALVLQHKLYLQISSRRLASLTCRLTCQFPHPPPTRPGRSQGPGAATFQVRPRCDGALPFVEHPRGCRWWRRW